MKKGFTLIELLGVILILGIIATIAIPIMLNAVSDAKEKTNEESIKMYIKAVDNKLASLRIHHRRLNDGEYEIMKDGNICLSNIDSNGSCTNNDILEIEYSGNKIELGIITIKNEKIDTYIINLNGDEYITGFENNGACYNFDSKNGIIIKYYSYENNDPTKSACSKDVQIPPYINNVKVVEIAQGAFYSMNISSVIFPDTLKIIRNRSFGINLLTNTLIIPDSVEIIEKFAFSENNIKAVKIGSGIKTIGTQILMGNYNLQSVEIGVPRDTNLINNHQFMYSPEAEFTNITWASS